MVLLFVQSVFAQEHVDSWTERLEELEVQTTRARRGVVASVIGGGLSLLGGIYGAALLSSPSDPEYSKAELRRIGWWSIGISSPVFAGSATGFAISYSNWLSAQDEKAEIASEISEYHSRQARQNQQRREQERREQLTALYGKRAAEAVMNETVYVGMPAKAVRASLGDPSDINRTVTESMTREQWVYEQHDLYVYIENGQVDAYQDSPSAR
jgi:hypothetical protein